MPLAEGVTIHCNDVAADASEKGLGGDLSLSKSERHSKISPACPIKNLIHLLWSLLPVSKT
jgi:hypothetical protein